VALSLAAFASRAVWTVTVLRTDVNAPATTAIAT
jgi:hypothetical protein